MSDRRARLRTSFEEVPELYDRARPLYPDAVFDALVALAGLRAGARILEIGCGTGQATVPLAERGLRIVCVELGTGLAAVARRNLAAYPRVEIVNADFESWEPGRAKFDAVVAFTAFHWLDPETRYTRTARLLRAAGDGGALAVVATKHVRREGGDPFWAEVQEDYDAVVPSPENSPPPYPDEVDDLAAEIAASGLFADVVVRRHLWDVTYTAATFIDVLNTHSGHRELDPDTRERLLDLIRRRIEARPDGTVTKAYLAMLHVARRR
jgi:SAM-dependent methyltransferase